MVRPLFDSAVAGLKRASEHFERATAEVRGAAEPSTAQTTSAASIVAVSAAARGASPATDAGTPSLEGALVDSRLAKYEFIANLRVIESADEQARELSRLARK